MGRDVRELDWEAGSKGQPDRHVQKARDDSAVDDAAGVEMVVSKGQANLDLAVAEGNQFRSEPVVEGAPGEPFPDGCLELVVDHRVEDRGAGEAPCFSIQSRGTFERDRPRTQVEVPPRRYHRRTVTKPEVEVIRSPRRRKTVEARRVNGVLEVRVPASMSEQEVRKWVRTMSDRVVKAEEVSKLNRNSDLLARTERLHQKYFDGRPKYKSIKYVNNQKGRFGSCTPEDGTIRISHVLAEYPDWVRDYVIVHELAHLRIPDHSKYFWRLVDRYPHAERAKGFLIAKGLEE